MTSVVRALRECGGIASVDQLRDRGLGRGAVRMAHSHGDIVRARRGWYALPPTHRNAPHPDRLAAARVGGHLSCISGGAAYGLWKPPDSRVHVSIFDHARHIKDPNTGLPITGSAPGVVVHWDAEASLGYGDVLPLGDCLTQVMFCQEADMAFAVVESALRQGRIDRLALEQLRRSAPTRSTILRDVGGLADSGTESLFRYRMALLGVSMQSQVEIDGVGRVDFLIGERLVVEIDSHAHHAGDNRIRDLTRDAILAGLGYQSLRFDYWMIIDNWDLVATTVLVSTCPG